MVHKHNINGPHALYVNPGCLEYISGVNLYPANKNFLTISFILISSNKTKPNKGILFKGAFVPKLFNNLIASCCLIHFDFLLSHTTHFNATHYFFVFLSLQPLGFLLSIFFLQLKQYDNIVL